MAKMRIDATVENLDRLMDFLEEQMKGTGFSEMLVSQVKTAAEEIFVNIAHYAYSPTVGAAVVCCEVGGDPLQITVAIADEGRPYDPLTREDPDITLPAGVRPIGGLGIFMTKKLMDEVWYEYKDGKNILTLRKRSVSEERRSSL